MKNPFQAFGYSALERMATAPKFNLWMYQTISPYLTEKTLEIGSGIGNLSEYFINDRRDITLSDFDDTYIGILKQRFPDAANKIIKLDLADINFKQNFRDLSESFDSIFLLNVLEHVEDDYRAIENCKLLLKPGGRLLVLVPCYPFLYSEIDRSLGHHRRYTSHSLNKVLEDNKLNVLETFHFNMLGIAGWYWNKIFKQGHISKTKMNLYNSMVPLARTIDKCTFRKIGLSVISIVKKECLKCF